MISMIPNIRERLLLRRIAAYERASVVRMEFGDVAVRQCKLCGKTCTDELLVHDLTCPTSSPPAEGNSPASLLTIEIECVPGETHRLIRMETGDIIQAGIPDHALAYLLSQCYIDGWMSGWLESQDKLGSHRRQPACGG